MPLIVYSSTYTGTGTPQFICLPFSINRYWILIKGDTTQNVVWTSPAVWYQRTSHAAAVASEFDEIGGVTHNGFWVLTDATVNSAGLTYYYLVVDDNNTNSLVPFSWMGNAVSGRTIQLPVTKQVQWIMCKRDSTELALHMTASLAQGKAEGGGTDAQGILGLTAAGVLTVGSSAKINELTTNLGEGIESISFCTDDNLYVTSYTGSGAGREISTPWLPEAAIIFPNEGVTGGSGTQMSLSTLGTSSLPWGAAGVQSGRITALASTGVTLGTHNSVNELNKSYTLVALKRNVTNATTDYPLNVAQKGILLLTNGTSMIECGASDTLKLDGAISLEWFGRIHGGAGATNAAFGAPLPIFMRTYNGSGGVATQGSTSWGIESCLNSPNHALGGFGTILRVVITDWHDIAMVDNDIRTNPWNTGVALHQEVDTHIVVTHDGSGKWRVYLNGYCVKERNIDMTTINAAYPNIASGTGHKTGINVRYGSNGTAAVGKQPMRFYFAAVWDAELTAIQARACYEARALRRSSQESKIPTATEFWSAANASSTTITAGITAANSGTITGGVVYNR